MYTLIWWKHLTKLKIKYFKSPSSLHCDWQTCSGFQSCTVPSSDAVNTVISSGLTSLVLSSKQCRKFKKKKETINIKQRLFHSLYCTKWNKEGKYKHKEWEYVCTYFPQRLPLFGRREQWWMRRLCAAMWQISMLVSQVQTCSAPSAQPAITYWPYTQKHQVNTDLLREAQGLLYSRKQRQLRPAGKSQHSTWTTELSYSTITSINCMKVFQEGRK